MRGGSVNLRLILKGLGLARDYEDATACLGKSWYRSKVLWVNVLAVLAMLAEEYLKTGLSAEDQVSILAVVNIALRVITREPLVIIQRPEAPPADPVKEDGRIG